MIWTLCLERLQDEMPANLFGMWIRPLQVEESDTHLRLLAPNPFFRKHIAEKYLERIRLLAADFSEGRIAQVTLEVGTKFMRAEEAPRATTPSPPPLPVVVERPKPNLNEGFTFANFVQGKGNQLAYAACQAVMERPADNHHNPLFLYGATGLGKTHLMQAVGHALMEKKPNARVLYLTSEKFVGGFVSALQRGAIDDFKKSCRDLDLLLIDDIHFLAGKGASLEEFFYTFNTLLENNGQIILTSDRYPKEIPDLDEQLKSRFSWGLTVQLDPPDLENRVGILRKKAEVNKMDLPKPAALFIAQHIQANVRELEGALNKVIATARFQGRAIDIDIVKHALKDVLAVRARQVNIDSIQKMVAEYYRIPLRELTGHKRTRIYARPRQIAMALARELTGESYPDIGAAFEGRDHTTVIHACDKVDELRKLDKEVAEDYHNLIRSLHG